MEKLLFGISGLPIGNEVTNKFIYKTGIVYLAEYGLDAMELPFVQSVNVTDKNKDGILAAKKDSKLYLSAHGSYYINLNASEELKQQQSMERIIKGAQALAKVDGKSLVFHPGFYLTSSHQQTFDTIVKNLKSLPYFGVDYRLETTGKPTQFGSIEELVEVCRQVESCKLCIDFSHIHARGNGALTSYDDFCRILQLVKDTNGYDAIEDMHIHMSGIHYGPKGEKNHLPFEESDFRYLECLKALKSFDAKGCVICESPLLEKDAILLKNLYDSL